MSPADSLPGLLALMPSVQSFGSHPPVRASQVPRPISRRALPPTTPAGPAAAPVLSTAGFRLQHSLAAWPPASLRFEAESGSLSHCSSRLRLGRLRRKGRPSRRSLGYMCARASHMAGSFHPARLARLRLALQRRRVRREDAENNRPGGIGWVGDVAVLCVRSAASAALR